MVQPERGDEERGADDVGVCYAAWRGVDGAVRMRGETRMNDRC